MSSASGEGASPVHPSLGRTLRYLLLLFIFNTLIFTFETSSALAIGDFSVAAAPTTLTIDTGGIASSQILIGSGVIVLTCADYLVSASSSGPGHIDFDLDETHFCIGTNQQASSTLTIAPVSAMPGTYIITVTVALCTSSRCTNFDLYHTISITVNVPPLSPIVGSSMPHPTFVNIYWDAQWDADNRPVMSRDRIDNWASVLVNTSYFDLAEYGVTSASFFGRSFMADPRCGYNGTSPPQLLSKPSLEAFINCEVINGYVPWGPNFIYNVFLAPATRPWQRLPGCGFHAQGTISSGPSSGNPFFFTAIFSDSPFKWLPCGWPTETMAREMVEAATDPYPPPSVLASGGGEIGDYCLGNLVVYGWMLVPAYWSNHFHTCVGRPNSVQPVISVVSTTGWGASMAISAQGQFFGALPSVMNFVSGSGSPISLPSRTNLPYFEIADVRPVRDVSGGIYFETKWRAGNSFGSDAVTLNYVSWSDGQIQINGFGDAYGENNLQVMPGDWIEVTVCNPRSGLCIYSGVPTGPTIRDLTPAGGPPFGGTQATIRGEGFGTNLNPTVNFGNQTVRGTLLPTGQIQVVTPANVPGNAIVTVVRDDGALSSPATFSYCGPRVESVLPSSGSAGTQVKITGSCFTRATSVQFGSAGTVSGPPNMSVDSDTQITAVVPPAPFSCGSVDVIVSVPALGGVTASPAVEEDIFTYGDPARCRRDGGDPCSRPHPPPWCTR